MAAADKEIKDNAEEIERLAEKKFEIIKNMQRLRLELTEVSHELRKVGASDGITTLCF